MERIVTVTYTDFKENDNSICETLFHNANGYIGVRGCLEEGVPGNWDTMRGMYINGVYDIIPMKQAEMLCNFVDRKETMINVVDTMRISCIIDGEMLDMSTGKVIEHTRMLNMDEGFTLRRLVWESPNGRRVEVVSKRMTSFELLPLFTIEYSVRALNFEGTIKLISVHNPDVTNYSNPDDPRLAAESVKNLSVRSFAKEDDVSIAVSETETSKMRVCSLVCNRITRIANAEKISETTELIGNSAVYTSLLKLSKGGSVTLEKLSILTDSARAKDVKNTAIQHYKTVVVQGIDYYYERQREYLKAFWKQCEMEIYGDDAMNRAVAFNMYQLLQSAAKDRFASIAAKGMSGEGYEGHYFWDTETFVLPFFTMTNPQIARMILMYRYNTLEKARRNAELLGHRKGVLFPWRTITGVECSGYFVSGSAAYHINADVAFAAVQYYLTTGDMGFMKEAGAELLIETARLWMDLGCYDPQGRFVLNVVTGPDEYTCMVNNNYYTNCAAKYNLNWAVKISRMLEALPEGIALLEKLGVTEEELEQMSCAAEQMLLLYDEKLGINPQDDSFLSKPKWNLDETPQEMFPLLLHFHPLHLYRYQVCKQADTVLSYFMFEKEQSREVMQRSYEYYEKITTHDSSLSTCVFSIVAARLGMKDKAYGYFGDSAKLDLENRHNNTKDGIHTANMGGCYMAIVNGFSGLRINEEGLSIEPFVPDSWTGYRYRIMYMGSLLEIDVSRKRTRITLLDGEAVSVKVFDKAYMVEDKVEI